jgi:hypothetical protein
MIFLLWVRQTQSPLAAGLLLSPRYALGDVGFLQGFQILFEPWQQVSNRIGHCLQTHSLRLPQIVECLLAPVYRALRVADPVTELSQCQFSVAHRGPLNATCVAADKRAHPSRASRYCPNQWNPSAGRFNFFSSVETRPRNSFTTLYRND